MNRFKLIALDVDGTLITDDHEISQLTKQSIQEVAKQGAKIVLCTGRNPRSTLPLVEQLELDGTVITHNGGVTVNAQNRAVVHEYKMSSADLKPYLNHCRGHGLHFDVNTAFDLYVEDAGILTEEVREMYGRFYIEPLVLPKEGDILEQIVKMTVFGTKEEMDELEQLWSTWIHGLTVIRSGDYFIDIMHEKASKGNALMHYAAKLGYDSSEVLAIGNYYNDITMLQYAGVGIAMDNSPIEVKAVADDVTASNNEDGVHLALQKYCLF